MTKRFALVTKKEVLYLFPIGLTAYLMGCVFVDRKNPREAHYTLKASADELFKNKYKIGMYPEGTRNTSHKILPFKKGAFALAIACQVPIIPIVNSPYYFLDSEKRIFRKGQVITQCLEPVSTEGLTMDDLPELMDSIQKMMQETFDALGKEIAERNHKNIYTIF
ncbi:1-acyl-sn-glycerol-3-phosphate acyltransferase beta-like [Bicyclus anynana]|uniref:1-acylglycerol-3-phosphate O-acyltransferase n=1 Tax=Bicyclus anynana TaxID=110368 RepID=A0A6J1MWV7_BICAN|nr:1-acyl-sn-glycerol-3-phosphate acyltransferase beta-like [Bicyclus anynana]